MGEFYLSGGWKGKLIHILKSCIYEINYCYIQNCWIVNQSDILYYIQKIFQLICCVNCPSFVNHEVTIIITCLTCPKVSKSIFFPHPNDRLLFLIDGLTVFCPNNEVRIMIYKAVNSKTFAFNVSCPESNVCHVANFIDYTFFKAVHVSFFLVKRFCNVFCCVAR